MTPKRGATDDIHRTDKRARTASSSDVSGSVPRHSHALPTVPSRPHARNQPQQSQPQGAAATTAEVVRLVLPSTSGRDGTLPDDPQTQTRGGGYGEPSRLLPQQARVEADDRENDEINPAEPAVDRAAPAKRGRWSGLTLAGDLSEGERQRRAAFNSDLLDQQATHRREKNREYSRQCRKRRADLIVQLQAENARLDALTKRLLAEAREGGASLCARCHAVRSIDDEIEEFLLNEQQHRHHNSPLVPLAAAAAAAGLDNLSAQAEQDLVAEPDLIAQPDNLLAGDSLDMQLWNNVPAGPLLLLGDEGQNDHHRQADHNLVASPPPVEAQSQSVLLGGGGGEGEGIGEEGHVEADGFWEGFDWELGTWGGGSSSF